MGAYNFRGWVPDHHGREYGSRQSGMVLPGVVVDSLSESKAKGEVCGGRSTHLEKAWASWEFLLKTALEPICRLHSPQVCGKHSFVPSAQSGVLMK